MRTARSSVDVTRVAEWQDGCVRDLQDYLVAEEPLEIRVNGKPLSVTMRTPGHDRELAAGFLLTEGVIRQASQISSWKEDARKRNVVDIHLVGNHNGHARRNFLTTSSCGVCGKASIDSIRLRGIKRPGQRFKVDPELLYTLPGKLRAAQAIFGRTGGLHAAAVFNGAGEILAVREDVGRHNALDKVVGWALLEKRLPLSENALMISGRGGFEIVQKALAAGLPVVASVSAPSGLAVQLAREFGLTLIGFLRGKRFVVYSGDTRVLQQKS